MLILYVGFNNFNIFGIILLDDTEDDMAINEITKNVPKESSQSQTNNANASETDEEDVEVISNLIKLNGKKGTKKVPKVVEESSQLNMNNNPSGKYYKKYLLIIKIFIYLPVFIY